MFQSAEKRQPSADCRICKRPIDSLIGSLAPGSRLDSGKPAQKFQEFDTTTRSYLTRRNKTKRESALPLYSMQGAYRDSCYSSVASQLRYS
ncbi:unnamed protein product, partial [Nesidiocoris tenuis]